MSEVSPLAKTAAVTAMAVALAPAVMSTAAAASRVIKSLTNENENSNKSGAQREHIGRGCYVRGVREVHDFAIIDLKVQLYGASHRNVRHDSATDSGKLKHGSATNSGRLKHGPATNPGRLRHGPAADQANACKLP